MRIAAKRLRYTLELARPALADDARIGDLTEATEMVKQLQTLLGEVHDCDVWIERFARFEDDECDEAQAKDASGESKALSPALNHLRQDRGDRRRQVFGELRSLWQEIRSRGVWGRLADVFSSGIQEPR